MTIRDLRTEDCWPGCEKEHVHGPSDLPRVKEIFAAQSFEYGEPDWSMMWGKVLVEHGVARIFLLSRKTVENYALVDSSPWAAPGMKATGFSRLDEAVRIDLRTQGYTDQHSWIPPVCKAFLRRLMKQFGWIRSDGPDGWTGITRNV